MQEKNSSIIFARERKSLNWFICSMLRNRKCLIFLSALNHLKAISKEASKIAIDFCGSARFIQICVIHKLHTEHSHTSYYGVLTM